MVRIFGVAITLVLATYCGSVKSDAAEERAACSIWTEEVTSVPAKQGWYRDQAQANRKSLRKPPDAVAVERGAKIIKSKRIDLDFEKSKSKPGAYSLYRPHSTFTITFQKLPCAE
jgi:hypothetical protein